MFLHEHTNEYNLYFNKVENVLKKMYSWAQSAPVQHDKETTSENLHSKPCLGHGCVWTYTIKTYRFLKCRFSRGLTLGHVFVLLLSTFTFYHCYSIYQ